MDTIAKINRKTLRLQNKYKKLIEDAYNFREIDSSLSDNCAYDAMMLLNELNKLKYLSRGFTHAIN